MSLDKGSMPAPIHAKTIHRDAGERLKGFGHVELATPEAAHKAFKMNGGDPSRDSKYSVIIIIAYSTANRSGHATDVRNKRISKPSSCNKAKWKI